MDDLDRLFCELVDSMRRGRPTALLKPLAVGEVHERVVPYRRVRDALGLRSNEDYEAALSRMLSGERGYLFGEEELQQDLRAGLNELVADIRRYRSYPEARIWLNPEKIPPPGDIRYAPPEVRDGTDWARAEVDVEAPSPDEEEAGSLGDPRLESAVPVDPDRPDRNDATGDGATSDESVSEATNGVVAASAPSCPKCAEPIPEAAAFCPFCGLPLSGECGSCGAAMQPSWRYCAACGSPRG